MKTILLVDDEDPIRGMLTDFLETEGYKVLQAQDGKEALDLFSSEVNIVVSDFNMPKMNGAELFWAIRKINPEIKFFLISGYFNPKQVSLIIDAGARFIQKPFQLEEVLHEIKNR